MLSLSESRTKRTRRCFCVRRMHVADEIDETVLPITFIAGRVVLQAKWSGEMRGAAMKAQFTHWAWFLVPVALAFAAAAVVFAHALTS
jgi:hypothetical protein